MTDSHEEALKQLYRDVWNGANPDTANELVHDRYYIHDREIAEQLQGPELYKALARKTREIFPDMRFTINDIVIDDDEIALRWTMTGTHEGPMSGLDPTGKHVEMAAIEINRFENGKLIETWTQSDQIGLLEQLNAFPASE